MKAVVLVPPLRDFYFTPHRSSSLGARVVRTLLKKEGVNPELIIAQKHAMARRSGTPELAPRVLNHLTPHLIPGERGPLSFFSSYRRFGPEHSLLAEEIRAKEPDLLFLSSFAFCYAEDTLLAAAACRKICPDLPIILGGPGPTVHPEYYLSAGEEKTARPLIQCLCLGEAEPFIPSFIKWYRETRSSSGNRLFSPSPEAAARIPNSAVMGKNGLIRGPGEITTAENMEIPLTGEKTGKHLFLVSGVLTRGCPKSCGFCSVPLSMGKVHRQPSFKALRKAVIAFLADQTDQPGPEEKRRILVNLEDDNLFLDFPWAMKAAELIRTILSEKHGEGEVRFTGENGLDYRLFREEELKQMISLGWDSLHFTLGNLDSAALKEQGRNSSPGRLSRLLREASSSGMKAVTYWIPGLEGDSPEKTVKTLLYLHSLPTRIGVSLFYPIPGIRGWENSSLFPRGTAPRTAGSSAYPWNGTLSTAQLVTAFRLSRLANLLKEHPRRNDAIYTLLKTIFNTRKLHTFVTKTQRVIPVPGQDRFMVELFLRGIPPNGIIDNV